MTFTFATTEELLENLVNFRESLELACENPQGYYVILNSDDFETLSLEENLLLQVETVAGFEIIESAVANPGKAQVLEKQLRRLRPVHKESELPRAA